MSFAGAIARLTRIRATLGRPTVFYASHLPQWREQAQRIAVAILQNARPPETDPATWARHVASESARIGGLLFFDAEEIGAILYLGIRPPGTDEADPKHADVAGIRIDEIERWVEAGRAKANPDDPGKNLDERDAGKTDLQIAWRLLYAIKLRKGNWEGLLGHIQEFLGSVNAEASAGLHREIVQAWLQQLGPVIRSDFRAWVRLVLQGKTN